MLYKLLSFLQLFIPYGLLIIMYKRKKALPSNIKTRTGRNLKAIMITTDNGILFSEEKYIKNRGKYLKRKKEELDQLSNSLLKELNDLSFAEKENLYYGEE